MAKKEWYKTIILPSFAVPLRVGAICTAIVCATMKLSLDHYLVLRLVIMLAALYVAYWDYKESSKKYFVFVFLIAAVLINPFIKFHFLRRTWEILDCVIAGFFAIELLFRRNEQTETREVLKRKEEIQDWIDDSISEIGTGKWGYHLAIAELNRQQKFTKEERDEIFKVMYNRYLGMPDEARQKDYEMYQLAQVMNNRVSSQSQPPVAEKKGSRFKSMSIPIEKLDELI